MAEQHRVPVMQYITVTLQCKTNDCPNEGFKWDRVLRSEVPGLADLPNYLCEGCMKRPYHIAMTADIKGVRT